MRLLRPLRNLFNLTKITTITTKATRLYQLTNHQRYLSFDSTTRASTNGKLSSASTTSDSNNEEDEEEIDYDDDKIYTREFVDMTIDDFEELYKDDATGTIKNQINLILQEYEFHKYNSMGRVPTSFDIVDMNRLLVEGTTPSSREKLFHYFFKRESTRRSETNKKEKERKERESIRKVKFDEMTQKWGGVRSGLLSADGELIYGLWHNSLFCRIPENKMKTGSSRSGLIQSALFGKKLIFDWDFNEHMSPWVSQNAAEQVKDAYGINRYQYYTEPFDIWFCNFNETNPGPQFLVKKGLRNLYNGSMITVKNDCFSNYFDKSRLVYLSPNAKERIDGDILANDDVYIIGVYNDKGAAKPLTFKKAEAMGIRCRSLPIDNHLAWSVGSKSLCVNHVTGVLLEAMSNRGDWRAALTKHIPIRKIKPLEVVVEINERRKAKMFQNRKTFNLRRDMEWD